MISYFTKQLQALPALMAIYRELGGVFVSTRGSTIKAIKKTYSDVNVERHTKNLGRFSHGYDLIQQSAFDARVCPLSEYSKTV